MDKCKVIHFGRNNPCYSYTMGGFAPAGTVLESVREEKDVGVIVSESLKPSAQCAKAVKKANSVLGQISRAFHYRNKETWIPLYKTFVRCHLEYCVQAWCPWTVADVSLMESVQMRAVRMVSGLVSTNYEERLRELDILLLRDRRERGDMIEVWKILHGVEGIKRERIFSLASENSDRNTRQSTDPLHILKPAARLEVRKNFFSVRVCDKWNNPPLQIRLSVTQNSFKNNYDAWLKHGI